MRSFLYGGGAVRARMGRRRGQVGLALLAAAVMLIAGVVAVDSRLRPLIQSYGYMAARRAAMVAVHNGVQTVLSQDAPSYRDLIVLERGEDGRVLSAETNVTAINRLKAASTARVMQELTDREMQTVRLPLGNLIGGSLMTGRGPFLPIRIHTSGVVIARLNSEFDDAGINQTRHRITLQMTVMMTAALPLERVAIEMDTDFLVCETVLVGEVPSTVMQLDLGGEIRNNFGTDD